MPMLRPWALPQDATLLFSLSLQSYPVLCGLQSRSFFCGNLSNSWQAIQSLLSVIEIDILIYPISSFSHWDCYPHCLALCSDFCSDHVSWLLFQQYAMIFIPAHSSSVLWIFIPPRCRAFYSLHVTWFFPKYHSRSCRYRSSLLGNIIAILGRVHLDRAVLG